MIAFQAQLLFTDALLAASQSGFVAVASPSGGVQATHAA
jgi:hypothetical protein